jgi:uncharacterized phage protein gp47/JayE
MSSLIPAPVLDDRNDEQLAAEMIGRVSGERDAARVLTQINALFALKTLIDGGALPPPVCQEVTNANPSAPHTVLLEVIAWALSQQQRKINQVPTQNQIAFVNLFGTGLREATKATTTLTFTSDGQHEATVPAGTHVSVDDGSVVFATDAELVVAADATEGSVAATCVVAGARMLAPNTLTKMSDVIAFVSAVTNPGAVDSGTETESIDAALQRARNFQRRGMRLVSVQDVHDFILEEVMMGAGIVKVFDFVKAGDFDVRHAGYVTIVMMTPNGNGVSAGVEAAITSGLGQQIGSIFFSLKTPTGADDDPLFVPFDVTASIKVQSIGPSDSIKTAVERNLRLFYAAREGNFGRTILRSEIISIIEGTPGVDRIVSDPDGPIVQTPGEDLTVDVYQLPKLNNVTLTVAP